MTVAPHNHGMWAVIGIYGGREDSIFWRRHPGGRDRLEAVGARALSVGEADTLDDDVIHSVTASAAIVYRRESCDEHTIGTKLIDRRTDYRGARRWRSRPAERQAWNAQLPHLM
jgi:predicted metal-dependent enzyme (double-stranded beta helix superfamily)